MKLFYQELFPFVDLEDDAIGERDRQIKHWKTMFEVAELE
jgi:hypothetical protein